MGLYACLDNDAEEMSFRGRILKSCKNCSVQPMDKLCDLIKEMNHCCLGTKTNCEHSNNCPNNQET